MERENMYDSHNKFYLEYFISWGVYANDGEDVVRQQHQNIEGSDRWQIIDRERSRSTSENA